MCVLDTYNQKLSHIYELIRLSRIDSEINDIEKAFIKKVAEQLGVNLDDLSQYDKQKHRMDLPDAEHKVIPLFHRLVLLMTLQADLIETRKSLCFDLGVKMGLHPQAVMEIISIAENEGVWDLDPKRITYIFNKFSN